MKGGTSQCSLAKLINAVHSANVLCQINFNGYDSHDFQSQMS